MALIMVNGAQTTSYKRETNLENMDWGVHPGPTTVYPGIARGYAARRRVVGIVLGLRLLK